MVGCRWVPSGAIENKRGHEEWNLARGNGLSGGYWNIKEGGAGSCSLGANPFCRKLMAGGDLRAICATNVPPVKNRGTTVVKQTNERNLLFPSKEFRDRVRSAAKERGFRSEQAFILAACENELKRGNAAEA